MLIHFLLLYEFLIFMSTSVSCLVLIEEDLTELIYTKLDCDYQLYLQLKRPPLDIQIGFEDNRQVYQYLIADRFVLRIRKFNFDFEYAAHSLKTGEFYRFAKDNANAFILFSDALMATKLTKIQANEIFYKEKVFKKHELEYFSEINHQASLDHRVFLYTNMNQSEDLILFNFFILTEPDEKIQIIHKADTHTYRIEQNEAVERLPFEIDTILFSTKEKFDSYEIIEFSNVHAVLRRYDVLRRSDLSSTSSYSNLTKRATYYSFLGCLAPVCEGGRVRGLVNFGDRHLFIFVEKYYKRIDQFSLFNDVNHVHSLIGMKRVDQIVGYPSSEKALNMKRMTYVFNIEFNNQTSALIRIDRNLYFIIFNEEINDLEIMQTKFNFVIRDGFMTTLDDTHWSIKVQLPLIVDTYTPTYLDTYKYVRANKDHFTLINETCKTPYDQLFSDNELVQQLAHQLPKPMTVLFVAIVDYDEYFVNLTMFTPRIAFTVQMNAKNASHIVKRTVIRIFKENSNFLKCHSDFMDKKFKGKLPVVKRIPKSEIYSLIIVIISFVFAILLTSFVIFILRMKRRRRLAKKNLKSIGSVDGVREHSVPSSWKRSKLVKKFSQFKEVFSGMFSISKLLSGKSSANRPKKKSSRPSKDIPTVVTLETAAATNTDNAVIAAKTTTAVASLPLSTAVSLSKETTEIFRPATDTKGGNTKTLVVISATPTTATTAAVTDEKSLVKENEASKSKAREANRSNAKEKKSNSKKVVQKKKSSKEVFSMTSASLSDTSSQKSIFNHIYNQFNANLTTKMNDRRSASIKRRGKKSH